MSYDTLGTKENPTLKNLRISKKEKKKSEEKKTNFFSHRVALRRYFFASNGRLSFETPLRVKNKFETSFSSR